MEVEETQQDTRAVETAKEKVEEKESQKKRKETVREKDKKVGDGLREGESV